MQLLARVFENELKETLSQEGKISVHCHYCNSDYVFTEEDANELFKK